MNSTELVIGSGCNEIGYGEGIRSAEDVDVFSSEENWDV